MIGLAFWHTCQEPKYGVSFGWAFTITTSYTANNSNGVRLSKRCALAQGLQFRVVQFMPADYRRPPRSLAQAQGEGAIYVSRPGGGSAGRP